MIVLHAFLLHFAHKIADYITCKVQLFQPNTVSALELIQF